MMWSTHFGSMGRKSQSREGSRFCWGFAVKSAPSRSRLAALLIATTAAAWGRPTARISGWAQVS